MRSLEEHDSERERNHDRRFSPHKNGIACPDCGKELWDTSPLAILTVCPPRKQIHCENCKFTGTRIA